MITPLGCEWHALVNSVEGQRIPKAYQSVWTEQGEQLGKIVLWDESHMERPLFVVSSAASF